MDGEQTDGADGRTDRKGGRMDAWKDGRTDGWAGGTDRWTERRGGGADGQTWGTDGRTDEQTDGQTNRRTVRVNQNCHQSDQTDESFWLTPSSVPVSVCASSSELNKTEVIHRSFVSVFARSFEVI